MMLATFVALAMAASPAPAESFGARSPAVLPDGGMAFVGEGGYTQMRLAFRQGLGGVELGVEGEADLFHRTLLRGLATLRTRLLETDRSTLSLDTKLGMFRVYESHDSDRALARSTGLALEFGTTFSYVTEWPVALFAQAKAPLETAFTAEGVNRLRLMIGGGAEVAISDEGYAALSGFYGGEFRQGLHTKPAAEVMLSVGWRVF